MRIFFFNLIVLQLALSGCDIKEQLDEIKKAKYLVEGTVRDADTGETLVGAQIQIGEESDVTGPDGRFRLPVQGLGEYHLDTNLEGYKPYSVAVNVDDGLLNVDVSLSKQDVDWTDHRFYGYIIDDETGRAIAFARATIAGQSFVADETGRFEFAEEIEGDTYTFDEIYMESDCLPLARINFRVWPSYSALYLYVDNLSDDTEQFGDLNSDNSVDIKDLDLFVPHMNSTQGQALYSEVADINQDGAVDYEDYRILRKNFGQQVYGEACK